MYLDLDKDTYIYNSLHSSSDDTTLSSELSNCHHYCYYYLSFGSLIVHTVHVSGSVFFAVTLYVF